MVKLINKNRRIPVVNEEVGCHPDTHRPTLKTRARVESCVMCGFSQERISRYMGFSVETLVKYYRKELDETVVDKTIVLADALYRDALKGCKASRKMILEAHAPAYKPRNNVVLSTEEKPLIMRYHDKKKVKE